MRRLASIVAPAHGRDSKRRSPGRVLAAADDTFERVGAITLEAEENFWRSAVIDPEGAFAYFGRRAHE